jgi:hypothetical protein
VEDAAASLDIELTDDEVARLEAAGPRTASSPATFRD